MNRTKGMNRTRGPNEPKIVRVLPWTLPLLAACVVDSRWPRIVTQKVPAPMVSVVGALLPSELEGVISIEPGSESVLVLRHGDPVQVRPAGRSAAYPLAFHDKDVHLRAGSSILCSPGGKVEVLWLGGTSVMFSGRTAGVVGSPQRGEPTFAFLEIDSALLYLREGDQVFLMGGTLLTADGGPIALEGLDSGVLRVENQSKAEARILFRDTEIILGSGEEVHLPFVSAGVGLDGSGFGAGFAGEAALQVEGAAALFAHPEGVRVIARGDNEVRALGVRLQLAEGEEVLLRGVRAPDAMYTESEVAEGPELDAELPEEELPSVENPVVEDPPVQEVEPKKEGWVPADEDAIAGDEDADSGGGGA